MEARRSGASHLPELYVAAGALTLIGTGLGFQVHPVFYALAAASGLMLIVTALREHVATTAGD